MEAIFVWTHETLNMCFYTLPALIFGAVALIVGITGAFDGKKSKGDDTAEGAKAPGAAASATGK